MYPPGKKLGTSAPFYSSSLSCYSLSTPLTLPSGDSPIFPFVVHQTASPSSGQQCSHSGGPVHKSRGVDDVMRMLVKLKRCVLCMCMRMLQRGHYGDGCVLASTLCKYDLRKGDLYVLT